LYHNYQLDTTLELIPAAEIHKSTAAEAASIFPLNINTAASSELEQLPGIGPVKAMAIINYISLNGSLTSAADVQKVKGIGPGIWRKIEKLVVFHP